VTGIAFFFGSPSEADARQAVESWLRCTLHDVPFRFIEFRKTGGEERSAFGTQWYEVQYQAVVEFPAGILAKQDLDENVFAGDMTSLTKQLNLQMHGYQVIKGEKASGYLVMQADSVINFGKKGGRWVGDRGC
jgi:hypothetical protein